MGRHSALPPAEDDPAARPAAPRNAPVAPAAALRAPAPEPQRARGTPAAAPVAGAVPRLQAPALRTAPVPVQPGAPPRPEPPTRPQPVGRVLAAAAALVVAGVVAGQLTSPQSRADVPTPVSRTQREAVPASGTTAADAATAVLGTTTPTPTPSAGTPSVGGTDAAAPSAPAAPSPTASETSPPGPSASASDPADSPAPAAPPASDPPSATPPTASSSAAPAPTTSPADPGPASPSPARTTSPSPAASSPEPDPDAGTVRSLRAEVSDAGGSDVVLGAGDHRFDDFRDDLLGVHLTGDLVGAGSSSTSIRMSPGTSSRAGDVPTKRWSTNQLSVLKVSDAKRISGFTLRATEQGHLYNGLRISRSRNPRITDVRVVAVPGNDDVPPGETFGINDFHTDGAVYRDVEVDGKGVGSADFGTNSSADTTIEDSWFHDSGHANGVTFWQTRDVTVRNTRSTGNHDAAFNFERVSGTVLLDRVTMEDNRLPHLRINSDRGSATYRIVDPVFDGPKLRILMTPEYMGAKNLQKKSDVHVIIDGVDRTDDVVQWTTSFRRSG